MDFKLLRSECIKIKNTLRGCAGPSRAQSTAITKIEEAQMWSGEMLDQLFPGENPYAKNDGKRKVVDDIAPTFDDTKEVFKRDVTGNTPIEILDFLREFIKVRLEDVAEFELHDVRGDVDNWRRDIAICNIMYKLIEARMWMGVMLSDIRTQSMNH